MNTQLFIGTFPNAEWSIKCNILIKNNAVIYAHFSSYKIFKAIIFHTYIVEFKGYKMFTGMATLTKDCCPNHNHLNVKYYTNFISSF